MTFSERRQNPGLSKDELEASLAILAQVLDIGWLTKTSENPIQKLWQRRDWLSTCELYTLGSAIERLSIVDKAWVMDQVAKIKDKESNNRLGAFFELMGLNLFQNNDQTVKLAKKNQQGYDGVVKFKDGAELVLSLKNYGLSKKHQEFIDRSRAFEGHVVTELKRNAINNIQVIIDIPKEYPESKDWDALSNEVSPLLREYDGTYKMQIINKKMGIGVKRIIDDEQEFDDDYLSYTIIVTSPYYQNEHLNLYSNLESACSNLIKAKIQETDAKVNCIFIHLSSNASINNCVKWSQDFFTSYPEDPVSAIIFYQPTVVSNEVKGTSQIYHCIKVASRARYDIFAKKHILSFVAPVGDGGGAPSVLQLHNGEKTLSIDDHYIYQSGRHYFKTKKNDDGSVGGRMNNQASGIYKHLIFDIAGRKMELQGIIPPSLELLVV